MKYRAVKCQTADEACRLLQDLATSQVERQAVPRTLRAVAQWIVDDQTAQQETRAGMGRMMLDAARRSSSSVSITGLFGWSSTQAA